MKRIMVELPETWINELNNGLVDKYGLDLKKTLQCLTVELYTNSESMDKILIRRGLLVKLNRFKLRYQKVTELNQAYSKKHDGLKNIELSRESGRLFQTIGKIERQLRAMDPKPMKTMIIG